ncbi:hypothetical protein BGZ83_008404 [Gryganskiella cystojenkinii]|nr:hypothetical protein BGZ83_008404 [Gryganskiella cystojenkinii]
MVSSATASSGPSYHHARQDSISSTPAPYHNSQFLHRPEQSPMHQHPLKQQQQQQHPQHQHYQQAPSHFQLPEQHYVGHPSDMMMDPYQPQITHGSGPGGPPPPQSRTQARGHGRTHSYTHSRSGSNSSVGGFPNQPMPVMSPNETMHMQQQQHQGPYHAIPEHPSWSPSLQYAQHPPPPPQQQLQRPGRRSPSPVVDPALHQRPIHHPHPYHVGPAPPTRPSSRSRSHSRSHSQSFAQLQQPQHQPSSVERTSRVGSPVAYHPSFGGPEEPMRPVDRPVLADPVRFSSATPLPAQQQQQVPPQQSVQRAPLVMVEDEEDDGEIVHSASTTGGGAAAPEEAPESSKCLDCGKVYKHANCLLKHRWEHSVYWKPTAKFLLSKHQQVQLMEAAAILLGMDESGENDRDAIVSNFIKQRGPLAAMTSIANVSPPASTKSFSASPSPRTAERRASAALAAATATVGGPLETARPRRDILEVPQHQQPPQQHAQVQQQHQPQSLYSGPGNSSRVKGSTRHSVTSTTSNASSLSSTPPSLAPDDESVAEMEEDIRHSHAQHHRQHYPARPSQQPQQHYHGMMAMDMPPPPPVGAPGKHNVDHHPQYYTQHDPRYPPFHHQQQHQAEQHHLHSMHPQQQQHGPPSSQFAPYYHH